ncbi:ABC transporter ATP-binding protein [Cohnella panacarvi]|uniref:ABC transporter ATP-binding protein n=1 Tax=Cohnella panacarvi TaxID=400776 RepID=UPI00047C69DD|nr:ABC transporter ATP-binding protein [Cohnella panacarvi]
MTTVLRTRQLTKTYQGKDVVRNVNMNVRAGEIYGFLGPNGAGKTTVMRMIANLVKPTAGEIELFGQRLTSGSYDVLGRMGAIIEYPVFYDKLTAAGNLKLHCEYMGYHDKNAIDESLELVGLRNVENKMVKDFSLGMKQRLGIARAIVTKPELLILDEPINGLDPMGIKEFRDIFKALSREYGITILISSHILGEIELVADRIGVINNGMLLEEVSMEDVREKNKSYIELKTHDCAKAAYVIEHELRLSNFRVIGNESIRIYDLSKEQQDITRTLIHHDVAIESIGKKSSTLEEYFLGVMKGAEFSA